MTQKELSEAFDKFMKGHQPKLPKEWEEDISFKQSQILYTGMLQKRKETLTFEDIDAAYLEGGIMARKLISKKYEKLLGFIDLLSHGALTQDQHDLLDKILEYTGEPEEVFRRIQKIYSVEELLNSTSLSSAPEQE